MNVPIWRFFAVVGVLSSWADKALEDNAVTLEEAFDLVEKLASALNLPMKFDLTTILGPKP